MLDQPKRRPCELATRFTDTVTYYVSKRVIPALHGATRKAEEDILGSNRFEVFHLVAAAFLWGQPRSQRSFCPMTGDEPWSER